MLSSSTTSYHASSYICLDIDFSRSRSVDPPIRYGIALLMFGLKSRNGSRAAAASTILPKFLVRGFVVIAAVKAVKEITADGTVKNIEPGFFERRMEKLLSVGTRVCDI